MVARISFTLDFVSLSKPTYDDGLILSLAILNIHEAGSVRGDFLNLCHVFNRTNVFLQF